MNALPYFKRCMEWYSADPDFRAMMDRAPEEALHQLEYENELDGFLVREAIKWFLFREKPENGNNPLIAAMVEHQRDILNHLERTYTRANFNNERLWDYENNTYARCANESRHFKQQSSIHYYPFVFELSHGCSVQCPFCGLAAEMHRGDFRFTQDNAALFRAVVAAAQNYAGAIVGSCPLYFATEPFDNPDYEQFMAAFREVTGSVPQTTTAIADRNPDRVRRYIQQLDRHSLHEHAAMRFSIRSLPHFHKLAATYSPQELMDIELVANNPDSVHHCSDSGRASQHRARDNDKKMIRYSISCLSGFRVNFAQGTVSFVEPEMPDEEFPLGYHIRGIQHFSTEEEFQKILAEFDRCFVHAHLPRQMPMSLNKNIRLQEQPDQYLFLGDGTGYRIGRNLFTAAILAGIRENRSFDEIMHKLPITEESQERLYAAFDALYVRGYLRV